MRTATSTTRERGVVIIPFAAGLLLFVSLAALAVDVGIIYQARRELQIAADGAAMAGVRELAIDNQGAARTKAAQIATANKVVGTPIRIDTNTDVQFGNWNPPTFRGDASPTNAMRVTLRRAAGTPQGPLPTFFAAAVGKPTVDIAASATAVLAAVDLAIVLDASSSMLFDSNQTGCSRTMNFGTSAGGIRCVCWTARPATGYQPWETLVAAANNFVGDFNAITDQLAVGVFANTASNPLSRTLTNTFTDVTSTISGLTPPLSCGTTGSRATNIGAGLQYALAELQGVRGRASAAKLIILVSDGQPNCPSATGTCSTSSTTLAQAADYSMQQANAAAAQGVVIHSISLGVLSDRNLMQRIAQATGGNEFYASTAADLNGVFAEVRKRVPVQLVN